MAAAGLGDADVLGRPSRWASRTGGSPSLREDGGRSPGRAPAGRHSGDLQDGGHLRRRVRRPHAVPLLDLRGGGRGPADPAGQGRHPRLRTQPDRPGHRVRLRVRARGLRAQGSGRRGDHGQLQPGDRLHRLRHLRPALLRAAHVRRRDEHRRARAAPRRDRAVRRPDAAQARRAAREGRRARSSARRPTPSTAPRTGSASPRCWPTSGSSRPRARPRARTRRRSASRRESATRCWCGRPTCSAGGPCRSSGTARISSATCPRPCA